MIEEKYARNLVEDFLQDALERRKDNNGEANGGFAEIFDGMTVCEIEIDDDNEDITIVAASTYMARAILDELDKRGIECARDVDDITDELYLQYLDDREAERELWYHVTHDR